MSTPQFQSASYVTAAPFALPTQWVATSSVLSIPAAWRAINLIANTVATCSPRVMNGFEQVSSFVDRPSVNHTQFEFWHELTVSLLLHGNSMHFIIRGENGEVEQLIPMPTETTCRLVNGYPVYECQGRAYSSDDILHVRGLTVPGNPSGIGVIEAHRRGLGVALDQMALASNQLRTGGVPSLVVSMPTVAKDFTPELAARIQTDFVDSFAGGQRKPAIIPAGMTVTPLSMSNGDMEFLSSRAFNVAEIAFMFNLDPQDLGSAISPDSSQMTYANLEVRETARLKNIAPLMIRIEQTFNDYVSGDVTFVPEKVLRADTASRYASYKTAIEIGIMTVNEARAHEGLPPLPETQNV